MLPIKSLEYVYRIIIYVTTDIRKKHVAMLNIGLGLHKTYLTSLRSRVFRNATLLSVDDLTSAPDTETNVSGR